MENCHNITENYHSVRKTCSNIECHNVTENCHNVTENCHNFIENCHNVTENCHNVTENCHNVRKNCFSIGCHNVTENCYNKELSKYYIELQNRLMAPAQGVTVKMCICKQHQQIVILVSQFVELDSFTWTLIWSISTNLVTSVYWSYIHI